MLNIMPLQRSNGPYQPALPSTISRQPSGSILSSSLSATLLAFIISTSLLQFITVAASSIEPGSSSDVSNLIQFRYTRAWDDQWVSDLRAAVSQRSDDSSSSSAANPTIASVLGLRDGEESRLKLVNVDKNRELSLSESASNSSYPVSFASYVITHCSHECNESNALASEAVVDRFLSFFHANSSSPTFDAAMQGAFDSNLVGTDLDRSFTPVVHSDVHLCIDFSWSHDCTKDIIGGTSSIIDKVVLALIIIGVVVIVCACGLCGINIFTDRRLRREMAADGVKRRTAGGRESDDEDSVGVGVGMAMGRRDSPRSSGLGFGGSLGERGMGGHGDFRHVQFSDESDDSSEEEEEETIELEGMNVEMSQSQSKTHEMDARPSHLNEPSGKRSHEPSQRDDGTTADQQLFQLEPSQQYLPPSDDEDEEDMARIREESTRDQHRESDAR